MTEQERPSKSQLKRQMHELQELGVRLAELNAQQLDTIELPADLRDALDEAHRVTGRDSRRRHMQYIGRLMREVDPVPIRAKIAAWDGQSREQSAKLHLIERWRDRLIEDTGPGTLEELLRTHPSADAQRLRALIRNARTEQANARPPKNYRELFRMLRELIQDGNS